jgi:cytochrome c-type biogenesis protein CcmE
MKPKHQRLIFVTVSVICLCLAALLTLRAFSENLVFFYSPSDLARPGIDTARLMRIGGLVEAGSLTRESDGRTRFRVSDGKASVAVSYQGVLPGLFREGQGVIAEGYLKDPAQFEARRILTKHDEKYMPPEVVDALKRSGRWQEGGK